jgi:anti-sigma B factor antagonist
MIYTDKIRDNLIVSFNQMNKLNVLNCDIIKDELLKVLDRKEEHQITIDLGNITFIDSSGFSLIIDINKHAVQQGQSIHFINLTEEVSELVQLMKLQSLFRFSGEIYQA